ncbi:MAG TPA: right-handed parallel beta-helix repeat-containing protein [Verrucomicrobiae bacterium]|nr:right-handed parallel beta-helix repeat-containing protein [Verrucomicrobiae bacterium]
MTRFLVQALVGLAAFFPQAYGSIAFSNGAYQVFAGDSIQEALELAAKNPTNKLVKVHAGEYRPQEKRQALIWFNKKHNGVRLEAEGGVTLTAANPRIADRAEQGFPAVVNHVVYFGDGISSNTVLKGFRITGANSFLTRKQTRVMEPDVTIPRNLFFFSDGGAIKIFGRSYPTIQNCEIVDNFTSPCGAGISVQQQGFNTNEVLIENCIFLRNRAQVTGVAVDLLAGSAARIINCLFVGNISNTGEDVVAKSSGEQPFVNNGALTIFQNSRAEVRNCTFTANRNGVDDLGGQSRYVNCIFFDDNLEGGLKGLARYELDVKAGAKEVSGCFINGTVQDSSHVVAAEKNALSAPPPKFNDRFVPESPEYKNAGYRPVPVPSSSAKEPATNPQAEGLH